GQLGRFLEPAIKLLGFDWKMGVGLVAAVAAKEVLVSTLATIYRVSDADNVEKSLQSAVVGDAAFSPLVAVSLISFCVYQCGLLWEF
ncbi:ferrous iron transport protein B, partial [bacterium]|nr:ferrous iron transport protein B [bacterium]